MFFFNLLKNGIVCHNMADNITTWMQIYSFENLFNSGISSTIFITSPMYFSGKLRGRVAMQACFCHSSWIWAPKRKGLRNISISLSLTVHALTFLCYFCYVLFPAMLMLRGSLEVSAQLHCIMLCCFVLYFIVLHCLNIVFWHVVLIILETYFSMILYDTITITHPRNELRANSKMK